MTEKELLYLEDAVAHETNIIEYCKYACECLEDESLANFISKETEKHEETKQNIIDLMEGLANE